MTYDEMAFGDKILYLRNTGSVSSIVKREQAKEQVA